MLPAPAPVDRDISNLKIYSWGANSHGQLGISVTNEQCEKPTEITKLPNNLQLNSIVSIRGGGGHVLILLKTGHLFTCGWNNKGQLGIGTLIDQYVIIEVNGIPEPVIHISCGWDTSSAITRNGLLYLWGSNYAGQMGVPKSTACLMHPTQLTLPGKEIAIDVSMGMRFTCVLTKNQIIYIFGKMPDHPNIRTGSLKDSVEFYQYLPETDRLIHRIIAGQSHILFMEQCPQGGSIIKGIGSNKFQQCREFNISSEVKDIRCGWSFNGILTTTGDVYLWGRNTYGQCAQPSSYRTCADFKPIILNRNKNEPVKDLHLGSEHGLCVTWNNDIYTWGWNEHGNCGHGHIDNLFEPEIIDIDGKCLIAGTGAGFCYAVINLPYKKL